MKKAVLTFHAHEKIEERLLMSAETLCDILDAEITVTTGTVAKSNRYHKLFYSPLNKMCFVAVQDCKTGHVVTVLPIDYHQNVAWSISHDAQIMARDIMRAHLREKEEKEAQRLSAKRLRIKQAKAKLSFRVYAYLEDEERNIVDRVFVCSWRDQALLAELENLIADDRFLGYLFDRLQKKRVSLEVTSDICIRRLSIQVGNKGEKTLFHLAALQWFNTNKKMLQSIDTVSDAKTPVLNITAPEVPNTAAVSVGGHHPSIEESTQVTTQAPSHKKVTQPQAKPVINISGKLETIAGERLHDVSLGTWQFPTNDTSIEKATRNVSFILILKNRRKRLLEKHLNCKINVISVQSSSSDETCFFALPD